MKQILYKATSYGNYLVKAKTKYYLHSPFVFQFYQNVLEGKKNAPVIESLRKMLYQNDAKITFSDFGKEGMLTTRTIANMAKRSSISRKYGKLLLNLVHYFQPQNILELGTNLGLGTAYLAAGNKNANVFTIEGGEALSKLAQANTHQLGITNIHFRTGNFNEVLEEVLHEMKSVDVVFFDGNHRKQPTLQYFENCLIHSHEQSIFVFDDIHWSEEMNQAWEVIKEHPSVTLSIEVYRMGFVFFNKQKLKKEHFKLLF
jgi:predicted O-methyltransferase YrrM